MFTGLPGCTTNGPSAVPGNNFVPVQASGAAGQLANAMVDDLNNVISLDVDGATRSTASPPGGPADTTADAVDRFTP